MCRRMLKKFLPRKKCIATSNADLEQGAIMTVSSLYKRREKKWHSTRSTLNRKSSSCRESLGKYLSLYSCNTLLSVYKNTSHRGHCAMLNLCNDIETNPGPPIYGIDPTLTIKAPYSEGDIVYFW